MHNYLTLLAALAWWYPVNTYHYLSGGQKICQKCEKVIMASLHNKRKDFACWLGTIG